MSKEIKFRAWDKDTAKYVDGVGELYLDILEVGTRTFKIEQMCPARYIIEQYTGLKDKNGKEIYEGDIVNIQGIRYYVDFAYGGFWFNNDNRRWKANRPFTHFQEINDTEVIGNIHENPELLKGGENDYSDK